MARALKACTLRRLDVQGFENVDPRWLAEVAPWQRLSFGLCAILTAAGTLAASPGTLLMIAPIAAFGAASAVHPFDLIYNHGIRHLTRTPPLPRRGAPARFACATGAVGLVATAWAFSIARTTAGYSLGAVLICIGALVSTSDVCIPSLIYRSMFGWPRVRQHVRRASMPAARVSVASSPG